jgi:hypothetical protein
MRTDKVMSKMAKRHSSVMIEASQSAKQVDDGCQLLRKTKQNGKPKPNKSRETKRVDQQQQKFAQYR